MPSFERDAARTAESRAQALERLLAERFTPEERRRVEALDRIEQEAQAERASP